MTRRLLGTRPGIVPLVVLVAAMTAGCGVDPQASPEAISTSPTPTLPSASAEGTPGRQLVLWFLRDGRLAPATRPATQAEQPAALDLLAAGPTPEEVDAGLRTALAQQPLTVLEDPAGRPGATGGPTVTVQVTPQFTSVTGADQLRAVAQVVFTVTEQTDVDSVRFASEDGALEVPTDDGLTDAPVDREDYASVAPRTGVPASGASSPKALPTTAPARTTGRRPGRRWRCRL